MPAQRFIPIVSGSLKAIIDKQPGFGRPHLFLVVVDVDVEASWTVSLVAAVPQGINPLIKLLSLRVDPSGGTAGTIVRRTLRLEETPPCADYREVWLGEGDSATSAKVSIVV